MTCINGRVRKDATPTQTIPQLHPPSEKQILQTKKMMNLTAKKN